jgi:hypothetical protein
MGHYAKVEDGIVEQVIVAQYSFIKKLPDAEKWIKTSYNTRGGIHYTPNSNTPDDGNPLRKNYAGIGFTYDAKRDAFIPPKPYESWVLDELTCLWEPPVPKPEDGRQYFWNEEIHNWSEIIDV